MILFDDEVRDRKSQPGAGVHILGCEERLEYSLAGLVVHTRTVVRNLHADPVIVRFVAQSQNKPRFVVAGLDSCRLMHGFRSISENI